MKTFVMLMVIVWFVFGISAAHERGFFNADEPRTCEFVGTAALTVVAGPLSYAHIHPHAYC